VLLGLLVPPSAVKYAERSRPIESNDDPDRPGRWLSGRKHPPAKRVGGVKLPRGFESLLPRLSEKHEPHQAHHRRCSGLQGRTRPCSTAARHDIALLEAKLQKAGYGSDPLGIGRVKMMAAGEAEFAGDLYRNTIALSGAGTPKALAAKNAMQGLDTVN
jgi:hypothetical protein